MGNIQTYELHVTDEWRKFYATVSHNFYSSETIIVLIVCVQNVFPNTEEKCMKSCDNLEKYLDLNEIKRELRCIILTLEPAGIWWLNNRISR
jgi:uncharacterized membrane protein